MSDYKPTKDKPVIPPTEWVLNSEEDFRAALPRMMKYRKLILQSLAAKMSGRNLFSAFLRNQQAHIRADSFFDAVLAMEMEVVVRPVQTSKTQQRIAASRAVALAAKAEQARQLAELLSEQAEQAEREVKESQAG
jgi:hypothetical protein